MMRATRRYPWLLLLLAAGCEADETPTPKPGLIAVIGSQNACASSLRRVTLVLKNAQNEAKLLSQKNVSKPSDLPFQVAIDLAPDSGSYTLVATFTTASPEAQSRQQIVVQSGASGRISLTLPCVCIGRQCAENENCREEKAGSGKTVCEAAETCGDGTCNGSEDTLSCQNDCPSVCGDGLCPSEETCGDCPDDCGECPEQGGAGGAGQGGTSGGSGQGGAGQAQGGAGGALGGAGGALGGAGGAQGGAGQPGGSGPGGAGGCGDAVCNAPLESRCNCPEDCGAPGCGECSNPPCPGCNNGACEAGENCKTCPGDCGSCPPECGDGVCNGAESCSTCAADCGTACYSSTVVRSYKAPYGHWVSAGCTPPDFAFEGAALLRPSGAGVPWYLCENSGKPYVSLDAGCEGGMLKGNLGVADATGKNGATELFRCPLDNGTDPLITPDPACEGTGLAGTSMGFAYLRVDPTPVCPTQCGDKLCSSGESCATCAADCGDGCYSVKVVRSVGPLGHWASINEPPPGYTAEYSYRIRADGGGVPWYLCDINGRQVVSQIESCEGFPMLQFAGWADPKGGNGTVEVFRCNLPNASDHYMSGDPGCEGAPGSSLDGSFGFVKP